MSLRDNSNHTVTAFGTLPAAALALLRPIENETEYEEVMGAIESLSQIVREDAAHPLAGVYATLIEHAAAYENAAFPTPAVPAHELIEFLMEQHDMRQTELAQRLGIDQSNVSRLLNGKKALTAELLKKLSAIFHVAPETFLT
ncbi:helix-turn-helix domain-containing protein [Deinococcus cavernae]|uniref:Helix-turn-helix domain-containing protein n=1 Tax=Deinococcus cavernae TaxID=2320857 RepID=A0A418VE94_9DEIO|nr:helix-turn-helix domain-containing protein [Deinococcus cavernae]RJF74427.1 helix-turn-helix domain-containing protein [Deinococcus cavernae]